jgi:putative membrane protein
MGGGGDSAAFFFVVRWHNRTMHIVRWIVGATVFLALLFLSLQNSDPAELKFFNVASFRAPLVVVVFVAFALGVAIGLLTGALRSARLSRQLSRARREQHLHHDRTTVTTGGAAPGTTPASGPGYGRSDRPRDGL